MADIIDLESRRSSISDGPQGESPEPRGSAVPPIPAAPPEADPPIRIARNLYFKLRPEFPSEAATLAALQTVLATKRHLLPSEAPPGDPALIRGWATEYGWEAAYSYDDAVVSLKGELDRAKGAFREAEIYLGHAREALDIHLRVEPDSVRQPLSEAGAKTFNTLSSQVLRWQAALAEAEDKLRKLTLERQDIASAARVEEVYQEYLEQYENLGPQYEHLCQQAAIITVRIEQMNASGRAVPHEEFAKMQDTYIKVISQLQKYTESTKSESISKDTIEMVKALLKIGEGIVGEKAPRVWEEYVRAVARKIGATVQEPEEQAS